MFELAFHLASTNWIIWNDVWTHEGPPNQSPILEHDHFMRFVNEYKVLRGFTLEERNAVREFVGADQNIEHLIANEAGDGISALAEAIQDEFGNALQTSFASKLATFLVPETFVASDRFSRDGVRTYVRNEFGEPITHDYTRQYPNYLLRFNQIWEIESQSIIERMRNIHGLPAVDVNNLAFGRRVLDVLLMLHGGRWVDPPHLNNEHVLPLL